jgi:hypothetical protein
MFIFTGRAHQTSISWQIVREWEEDFSEHLGFPLIDFKVSERTIFNKLKYHKRLYPLWINQSPKKSRGILFEMVSPYYFGNHTGKNIIPIIIDIWRDDLKRLEEFCTYHPLLFLGSLEAVKFLRSKGWGNVHYLPVCISDRHLIADSTKITKNIDIVLFGRAHHLLRQWVRTLSTSSRYHIIECYLNSYGKVIAHSNIYGEVKNLTNRVDFFNMLQKSKYTIVSAPGIDIEDEHDQKRTGGFSPVTPRFFECAVNYSTGIGFFPNNLDYEFCGIKEYSIQLKNYEHLLEILNSNYSIEMSKESALRFLKNHWSSTRAAFIKSKLNEIK